MESKLAYLAGLIDGEGYLGFHKRRANERISMVDFAISNTNLELINWLHENFGGQVYWIQRREAPRQHNRPIDYTWRLLKNTEIYTVLKACLPFLVAKRDRAKLILEFLEQKKNPNINLLEKFYAPMKLLNNPNLNMKGKQELLAKLKKEYSFPLKVERDFERLKCSFCGHSWIPRPNIWKNKIQTKPLRCPNCQKLLEPTGKSLYRKDYAKLIVGVAKH